MEKEEQPQNVEKKRIVIELDHLLLIIALLIIVIIAWAGTLNDSEESNIHENSICSEDAETESVESIYINTNNLEINTNIAKL